MEVVQVLIVKAHTSITPLLIIRLHIRGVEHLLKIMAPSQTAPLMGIQQLQEEMGYFPNLGVRTPTVYFGIMVMRLAKWSAFL